MNLALLHIQHHHRLDEPGAARGPLVERALVRAYLGECRARLLSAGLMVEVYDPEISTYEAIHYLARQRAKAAGVPALYIAGHVNAGGGDYGLVGCDARSARGYEAAQVVARHLRAACPEVSRVQVAPLTPGCAISPRGFDCIDGVGAPGSPSCLSGLLLEPGFIDQPRHAALWTEDGLRRLGYALADGIVAALAEAG